MSGTWLKHGQQDCALDQATGQPFASIGGPEQRSQPEPPKHIPEKARARYLQGYVKQAVIMYGADWAIKIV